MIYIFGHKNPDTDSIVASLVLTHLKKKLGIDAQACRLGPINEESQYILNRFKVNAPSYLKNVKTQVADIPYTKASVITLTTSIMEAIHLMEKEELRSLAVISKHNYVMGIVDLQELALTFIKTYEKEINAPFNNIFEGLSANSLTTTTPPSYISGEIIILAYHHNTLKKKAILRDYHIAIIGDRHDITELAIEKNVPLIIVTGNHNLPQELIDKADAKNITIISTPFDSYETSKKLPLCNTIATHLKRNATYFCDQDYLSLVVDDMKNNPNQSAFPIIDEKNRYLGMLSRKNLIGAQGKNVILVDHNEYVQSAEGLRESVILEIYDHHKLGDIKTTYPMKFKNLPLGSTSTLLLQEFLERHIMPDNSYCGLILGGIISDTLMLTSPTTTDIDKKYVALLEKHLGINANDFAKDMFKAGTTIGTISTKELFHKDLKWFESDEKKACVSQIFTLDIDSLKEREAELENIIIKTENKNLYVILLVTDILKKGSYIYYESNSKYLATYCFGPNIHKSKFLEGIVSRKKQVMPKVMEFINSSNL